MTTREERFYNFEVRVAGEPTADTPTATITGRPIVYGQVTDIGPFDEVIERGALDDTDLKDVPLLVNHDRSRIPVARSRNNTPNSTMQLNVDGQGMAISRADLDVENNSEARALYSAVRRGDITGMSFAFRVGDERWENLDSDHPTRHILRIEKVYEVSAVTYPAYDRTEIQARNKEALESARRELESARSKSLDRDALDLEKQKIEILYGRR